MFLLLFSISKVVDAIDLSPEAVVVARKNVHEKSLSQTIRVLEGNLFQPLRNEEVEIEMNTQTGTHSLMYALITILVVKAQHIATCMYIYMYERVRG